MLVSIIVAMGEDGVIGVDGRLPWHLRTDLLRFKTLTMGHYLIMGRKTYESIGRPLPGRVTIVLTRNLTYKPPGCLVAHSLEEALALAEDQGETEVFVCGGAEVYARALPLSDRLYLTRVHATPDGTVYFPPLDPLKWTETWTASHPAGPGDDHPFTFQVWERKSARL